MSYHLADAGIAGQDVGVLNDGQSGGSGGGDLQHTAPLGKVCTVLLVLCAALRQPVQTCTHTNSSVRSNTTGCSAKFFEVLRERVFLTPPTLSGGLSICSSKGHNTFVHLKKTENNGAHVELLSVSQVRQFCF